MGFSQRDQLHAENEGKLAVEIAAREQKQEAAARERSKEHEQEMAIGLTITGLFQQVLNQYMANAGAEKLRLSDEFQSFYAKFEQQLRAVTNLPVTTVFNFLSEGTVRKLMLGETINVKSSSGAEVPFTLTGELWEAAKKVIALAESNLLMKPAS